MSMGSDYVSKLRPPMGILFIPQVIHENGLPRWNDINRAKFLIHPPQLSGNPRSSHIVANQGELGKGDDEFGLWKYLCSYFKVIFTLSKIL
jgi:hypothetical protein